MKRNGSLDRLGSCAVKSQVGVENRKVRRVKRAEWRELLMEWGKHSIKSCREREREREGRETEKERGVRPHLCMYTYIHAKVRGGIRFIKQQLPRGTRPMLSCAERAPCTGATSPRVLYTAPRSARAVILHLLTETFLGLGLRFLKSTHEVLFFELIHTFYLCIFGIVLIFIFAETFICCSFQSFFSKI